MRWAYALLLFINSNASHNEFKSLFDQVVSTTQTLTCLPLFYPNFANNQSELEIQDTSDAYKIYYKKGYYFIYPLNTFSPISQRKYRGTDSKMTNSASMIQEFMKINYHLEDDRLRTHIYSLYKIHIMPKNLKELNTIIGIIMSFSQHNKEFAKNIVHCKVKKK